MINKLSQKVIGAVLLLFLFFLQLNFVLAQQVVSCSGNSSSSASAQLSYTIGEPVAVTVVGAEAILSSGFQQGFIQLTAIEIIGSPLFDVAVYPNPTDDLVKLNVLSNKLGRFACVLFDASGKQVIKYDFEKNEAELSLGFLSPAVYLLKVYDSGNEVKVFRIVKTNN